MKSIAKTPIFSIVIPTRNRHRAIRECVAACLSLDFSDNRCEILIVDDGSEPPVAPFDDPRVRLIRQSAAGPAVARNRGIRAAAGKWIALTDDDCRPRPDWLVQLGRVLAESPAALVGGNTVNGLPHNPYTAASQFLVDYLYKYFERRPAQWFFTSNNFAGARERFLAVSGFDEGFPFAAAEDRDLCDRWKENGGKLQFVPGAVIDHYHNMSFTDFLRQQFRYGEGARILGARRAARGVELSREPRTFYFGLLGAPFRSGSAGRAIQLSVLLFLAQAANVAGFLASGKLHKQA